MWGILNTEIVLKRSQEHRGLYLEFLLNIQGFIRRVSAKDMCFAWPFRGVLVIVDGSLMKLRSTFCNQSYKKIS